MKKAALAILVYKSDVCCKYVPRKSETLINIKYLKNRILFIFIFCKIFFLSKKKAIGKIVKNPTKNLAALKERGPILSMPVSCAINAVPHINVVTKAHTRDVVFDI